MARLCGSLCGLIVFSAQILLGLAEGSDVEGILVRALVGLFGGLTLGAMAGWVVSLLVQDHLPAERNAEEPAPTSKPEVVKSVS